MNVKIICPHDDLVPSKGTEGSAGFDLKLIYNILIPPHSHVKVGTGVKIQIPSGWVGLVVPRSSTGSKGLQLLNTIGVIDSDYRGEIFLTIYNGGAEPYLGYRGDRLFQLLILPAHMQELERVSAFEDTTNRDSGGFGSTGQ